uniref:Major facilitator superfamily (MFS) profile domain-containing protein n=1 Tax=Plectus sambesii TaxID=2011161 RepID=A0A914UMU1_9BILA
MTYSRGAIVSLLIHTLLGAANVYQQSAMNVLQEFIMPFANQSFYDHYGVALTANGYSWLWSSLQSVQSVGIMISVFLFAPLMDNFGRRNTVMIFSSGIMLAGLIFQILAKSSNSFEMFGSGQFLCGVSQGSYRVLYQYFAESLPSEQRGRATLLYSFAMIVWTKLGIILAFPFFFGSEEQWPLYFAPGVLPCVLYVISAYFVPESPKYLYLHKKKVKEANEAIRYYYGKDADVASVLLNYDGEIFDESDKNKSTISLSTLLTNPIYRYALEVCLIANVGVHIQCSGALLMYSNGIMLQLGLSANEALTILLGSVIYVAAVSMFTAMIGVNRFGRVTLMNASNIMVAAAALLLGLQFALKSVVVMSHSMTFYFALTWGFFLLTSAGISAHSICILLIGEISPTIAAGKIVQLCTIASNGTSLLVNFTFPPLLEAFGSSLLFMYAGLAVACTILFRVGVPETKGKSVVEVIESKFRKTEPVFV